MRPAVMLTALLFVATPAAGQGTALESVLDDAVERIERRHDALHAVIVVHDGETVAERRLRGPALSQPHNLKSLSKTIVALLAGIAIERGIVDSVDTPLVDLLGARVPADATDGVAAITLGDALSLQAGLRSTSGRYYGRWVQSKDWVAHALTRPLVAEPGTRMIYSTGATHLAGAALVEAADRSLLALARDWLGEPLGIDIPDWMRDPQGIHFGGNEMRLSPRALARIGEMVRNGGVHDGRQVVPSDWIRRAWTPRGTSPWSGDEYGYGWFVTELGGQRAWYGRGYGGQMLYVVPAARLTVVVTSRSTPPSAGGRYVRELHRLVADLVRAARPAALQTAE